MLLKNQMADTFFDLDSSLNKEENLVPPDSDEECLENEDEYDALNDETFGALEDVSTLDDWEQQHEQFAIAESSKNSGNLENSISQKVLDESEDRLSLSSSVWSYTPTPKNGDAFNNPPLQNLQNTPKSFNVPQPDPTIKSFPNVPPLLPAQPKKICTVEELEKSLLSTSRHALAAPQGRGPPPPYHPMMVAGFQQPMGGGARLPPPGMLPMGLPPGMLRVVPPHFPYGPAMPPRTPGFLYPPGGPNQFPAHHPFNYPPPLRTFNNMPQAPHPGPYHQHQQQHMQQQQLQQKQPQQQRQQQRQQSKQRGETVNHGRHYYPGDDHVTKNGYCGMMTLREKQWLLNIQMLQLNTGTPYFDDYYYTIFKEKKSNSNKENIIERGANHQKRQHRNSDRQENSLTPRVYTPLQFENSLGKLQCGSVTAPRKIIDMDIVTPDKDGDGSQGFRDVRRTKQLLLELEALYALLLKAEDIGNPMYITNMEKLREIKQKQRLRELELAPLPEQKQEILRIFKLESQEVIEHQHDYIVKIVQGLLQEDKFGGFLNIRKGKVLILRLLSHLSSDFYAAQLTELWNKMLLSLPTAGRRDTAGDNMLPKFYPYFKRFVQTRSMSDILAMLSGLVEVVKQENSRSTPLSHVGKPPLYFVLLNKFGVSALASVLIRADLVLAAGPVPEDQQAAWTAFLSSWAHQVEGAAKWAAPMEPVPPEVLEGLAEGHRVVLEKLLGGDV